MGYVVSSTYIVVSMLEFLYWRGIGTYVEYRKLYNQNSSLFANGTEIKLNY